jgi:hypothetical protein
LLTFSYMPGFGSIRYVALALLVGCGGIDVSNSRASTARVQGEPATSDCAAIVESGANDPGTNDSGCSTPPAEDHCWLAVQDGGFGERALTTQASAFTASVSIVPSADGLDGVIGLSALPATTAGDLAVAVRFNADGTVDASSGEAYASVNPFRYAAGSAYRVLFVLDAGGRSYSAWVNGRLLAQNYAFRGEPRAALTRFTTAVNSGAGALRACDFADSSDDRLSWLHHAELYAEPGGEHALVGRADGGLLITGETGTQIVDATGAVVTTFMHGGRGVALDEASDLYLFGEFTGSYDGGSGTLTSAGGTDVFVSKYDAQFTHLYTRSLGGAGDDRLGAFDVNEAGDFVVVVGSTLMRFDASGALLWTRAVKDAQAVVALDGTGIAYVAENGTGVSAFTLTALDTQGAALWTESATAGNNGTASALALRPSPGGGVALSGAISGSLELGGTQLRATRTDRAETYVAWLDPGGAYLDSTVLDLTPNSGLGVDDSGTATIAGYRPNPDTYLLERIEFDGSSVTGVTELGGHELTRGLFRGTASAPAVDRAGNAYWSVTARLLPEQSAQFLLKVAR